MKKKNINNKNEHTPIRYAGFISASVRYGDKVIATSKHKNEGTKRLFTFIANCLCGDYKVADPNKPQIIGLFTAGDAGDPLPTIPADELSTYLNAESYALYNSGTVIRDTPIVQADQSGQGINAVFSFMIPFTQIDLTKDINLCALYAKPLPGGDGYENPLAYFLVKDEQDEEKLGNLLPEGFNRDDMNKYNLFIEWKLNINNINNNQGE